MTRVSTCAVTGLRYRVAKSDWGHSEPEERTISLEISTGNPRCSGDPLMLQLNWARERANRFEISLGDTLRIHNYISIGHPEWGVLSRSEAELIARNEGDTWLRTNESIIDRFIGERPYKIIRWEEWRTHPDFDRLCRQTRNAYFHETLFADVLRADLVAYMERLTKGGSRIRIPNEPRTVDALAEYMIEELAVYSIQAAKGDTVNVYPGGQMNVFKRIREFTSLPESLKDRRYVYLNIDI